MPKMYKVTLNVITSDQSETALTIEQRIEKLLSPIQTTDLYVKYEGELSNQDYDGEEGHYQ